ncbi:MAG TPA: phosphoribosylformylglycinamidine synthase subunit PurQ [Vicinamibacterales bacterium]|nr:phosphoribosylformylglycinamidine synthase subunit PurQ [Vicinamibacterales bacterium]
MKFAVVVFPGSNSDRDAWHAASQVLGEQAELVWHKDTALSGADAVILPGGFAYGDYLRTGAIARFSPIMAAVSRFAERGGPVIGICNGFQVLLEAGLLPGAMVRNRGIKFVSRHVHVRVEHSDTPFTAACRPNEVLELPIAHGEGNYFADPSTMTELDANRQVIFRYVTPTTSRSRDGDPGEGGDISDAANPNGSLNNIAGICNRARNVVGLMPHPERACELALGSADGRVVLQSMVKTFTERLTHHG